MTASCQVVWLLCLLIPTARDYRPRILEAFIGYRIKLLKSGPVDRALLFSH